MTLECHCVGKISIQKLAHKAKLDIVRRQLVLFHNITGVLSQMVYVRTESN